MRMCSRVHHLHMVGYIYASPIVLCVVYAACVHELGLENKANAIVYTARYMYLQCYHVYHQFSHIYMGYEKTSLDLYVFIMRVCSITFEWLF